MATAALAASGVSTSRCSFVKAASSGLSRSNTPTQRSFTSSGTTSSDRASSTTLMYRGSFDTSSTMTGTLWSAA